jgi:hypothetical protein
MQVEELADENGKARAMGIVATHQDNLKNVTSQVTR